MSRWESHTSPEDDEDPTRSDADTQEGQIRARRALAQENWPDLVGAIEAGTVPESKCDICRSQNDLPWQTSNLRLTASYVLDDFETLLEFTEEEATARMTLVARAYQEISAKTSEWGSATDPVKLKKRILQRQVESTGYSVPSNLEVLRKAARQAWQEARLTASPDLLVRVLYREEGSIADAEALFASKEREVLLRLLHYGRTGQILPMVPGMDDTASKTKSTR